MKVKDFPKYLNEKEVGGVREEIRNYWGSTVSNK